MRMKIFLPLLGVALLLLACRPTAEEQVRARVMSLTDMAELGTVEYTVKKLIKCDDDIWYKYGDRKIILSGVAYLKAGIDMTRFDPDKVRIDRGANTISVTLPKAELLSFNMPVERIKQEFERVSGLRWNFSSEELLRLKQQGEAAVRADVPGMGILEDAEKNAKEFFEALFSGLGYEKVNVDFE